MNVAAYGPDFKDSATRVHFYQELAERTRQLPGVVATGAISALPLTPTVGWGGIHIEGYAPLSDAKEDVAQRRIGATQEIVDMLDAFLTFLKHYFFADSRLYPLLDRTNRHGILHGAYKDADYGRPINFYKVISAVEILTFVSMLRAAKMSGFAPEMTPESRALAESYLQAESMRENSGAACNFPCRQPSNCWLPVKGELREFCGDTRCF